MNRVNRSCAAAACAVFAALFFISAGAKALAADGAPGAEAALTRGPFLQLATPESIFIVWRTDGASKPVVRYGEKADKLDHVLEASGITTRVSEDVQTADSSPKLYKMPDELEQKRAERKRAPASTPPHSYQYESKVSGLIPYTTYYYAVYDGGRKLAGGEEAFHFRTLPAKGDSKPLRFWVVGDSGTGGPAQKSVRDSAIARVEADKHPLDMYLHVGDMAYTDGTDTEFQKTFFDIYQSTLRNTVCWPAIGNHEGATSHGSTGIGPYFDAYVVPTKGEAGGVASGTEAYYSFDAGKIHFIALDSHDLNRKPTGAMAQWLKADLEKAKADWLIAFWHHPPYSKGSHDSDKEGQLIEMRTHILPILEAAGVDLVLTGHSHIYERSMLMDGAYETPTVAKDKILDDRDGDPTGEGAYRKSAGLNPHEGDVQVVAGNGGGSMNRRGTMPVMKKVIVEFGSVIVDVDGNTLKGIMVNKEGVQRDLFSIVKEGKVTPKRMENPRELEPFTPPARPAGGGGGDDSGF